MKVSLLLATGHILGTLTTLYIIYISGYEINKKSTQNTIKHAQKGKYKNQIDAIIDKSSKVRR